EKEKGGPIFTLLNYFFAVYQEMLAAPSENPLAIDKNAVAFATALSKDLDPKWTALIGDARFTSDVMDNGQFTEIFRRITGFLAFVNGMLIPLLDPSRDDRDQAIAH